MVEMSCEEHDQLAASTQFITHTVGRMLGAMQVCSPWGRLLGLEGRCCVGCHRPALTPFPLRAG